VSGFAVLRRERRIVCGGFPWPAVISMNSYIRRNEIVVERRRATGAYSVRRFAPCGMTLDGGGHRTAERRRQADARKEGVKE